MRTLRFGILLILLLPLLFSCNNKLNVNADWKDITVVYGLLNQNDSVQYLKITKAFLGEGNALSFAKIPDSSYYRDTLNVRLEGWLINSKYDSTLKQTIHFQPVTINNKEGGDSSIFFFPSQMVYQQEEKIKLSSDYVYHLYIINNTNGKQISSQTQLVNKITEISQPSPAPARASFIPGTRNKIVFNSVKGGKRYQMIGRFHYIEIKKADTSDRTAKYIDWVIFNNLITDDTKGAESLQLTYSSDAFYSVIGNGIHKDITNNNLGDNYTRVAYKMEYIFSVAGDDMNTYMEVTEPSYTIVQEKPPFTNIINGIGIFSARYNQSVIQSTFGDQTLLELRNNQYTSDLGF